MLVEPKVHVAGENYGIMCWEKYTGNRLEVELDARANGTSDPVFHPVSQYNTLVLCSSEKRLSTTS